MFYVINPDCNSCGNKDNGMYNTLKKIAREKGREGLLPQNLNDQVLVQLLDIFIKITKINAHHPDFFDDQDIVKELSVEIKSIGLLVKMFTANNTPNNDEFDKAFRSLRYYYWVEKYRRDNNINIRLPTIETILDHPT
jgi:hypothetical protein